MSSSDTDLLVEVTMPQMGTSVSEGTVIAWLKGVGDSVSADEPICEVSTDKVDTECPSPATGIVAEILVEVDETVDVGTVLARIATGDGARDAPSNGGPDRSDERAAKNDRRDGPRSSPVARRLARAHGIDLASIDGSGRGGRVTKGDVLARAGQAERPTPAERPLHTESPYRPEPVPAAPATDAGSSLAEPYQPPAPEPLSRMRQSIGAHMKRSLDTAATCTTWTEVDLTAVQRARKEIGVTALAFVARATIDALHEFPELNAWMEGERRTIHSEVNLGIAVSLGADGLIVPVIRSAQDLNVEGLASRIRELAERARSKRLSPDDVQGATFTITNPGQFGSIMATPVISQPQVAILDLEAIVKRPVVKTGADGTDAIAVREMSILGMSWDHRALDGVYAAQFLAGVRDRLEAVEPRNSA